MVFPELYAFIVLGAVKRHTTATLCHTQCVAHHCNGLHGGFKVYQLWFDGNQTPRSSASTVIYMVWMSDGKKTGGLVRGMTGERILYAWGKNNTIIDRVEKRKAILTLEGFPWPCSPFQSAHDCRESNRGE